MIDFVNKRVETIFEDFKKNVESREGEVCKLKGFNFMGDNLPEYSDPLTQQFYLLKYLCGYFAEYTSIYRNITGKGFLDRYKVLSIGCGCGLDLWGLKHACNERFSENKIDRYTGIDRVSWNYRETFGLENIEYRDIEVDDIKSFEDGEYNIIIFPKSIGEFSESTFNHLKDLIFDTKFAGNKVVFVASIRKARFKDDFLKVDEIREIFTKKGYKLIDVYDHTELTELDDRCSVSDIVSGVEYSKEVDEYFDNLYKLCKEYQKTGRVCDSACINNLTRKRVSTMSQANYQILYLERQ